MKRRRNTLCACYQGYYRTSDSVGKKIRRRRKGKKIYILKVSCKNLLIFIFHPGLHVEQLSKKNSTFSILQVSHKTDALLTCAVSEGGATARHQRSNKALHDTTKTSPSSNAKLRVYFPKCGRRKSSKGWNILMSCSGTLLLEDTGTVDCAKTCGLKKKKINSESQNKKEKQEIAIPNSEMVVID